MIKKNSNSRPTYLYEYFKNERPSPRNFGTTLVNRSYGDGSFSGEGPKIRAYAHRKRSISREFSL